MSSASSSEIERMPTCVAGTISRTRRMTQPWLHGVPLSSWRRSPWASNWSTESFGYFFA